MARPLSFDRQTVLAQIKRTFWRQGYEATSLSDLVGATGLRKGSLYASFGDKAAMYCSALALYDADEVEAGIGTLTPAGGEAGMDAISRFLGAAAAAVKNHSDRSGCLLCNALGERMSLPEEARDIVDASLDRLVRAIEAALDEDVPDRNAKAQKLMAVYIGLRTLARGNASPDTLAAIQRSAVQSIAA